MYLPTPHCNLQVIWFCSVMIRSSHDIIKAIIFNFHCSYRNVKCHSKIRDVIKNKVKTILVSKLVELKQLESVQSFSHVSKSKLSNYLFRKIVEKTVKEL